MCVLSYYNGRHRSGTWRYNNEHKRHERCAAGNGELTSPAERQKPEIRTEHAQLKKRKPCDSPRFRSVSEREEMGYEIGSECWGGWE